MPGLKSLVALSLPFVALAQSPSPNPGQNATVVLKNAAKLVAQARLIPTVAERIALLENEEYEFDFTSATTGLATGSAGHSVTASSLNFPALVGTGMSMTVGFLGPCGLNTPHTHPRATELNYVVSGELRTGMLMENGARFVFNEAKAGTVSVFPAGAIHFEQNNGCDPVTFVAHFNHEDAGVTALAQRFFGLPPDIVGAALGGLTNDEIAEIEAKIPNNIAQGTEECLKRCGITRPATQPLTQRQTRNAGNKLPQKFNATADPAALYPDGSKGVQGTYQQPSGSSSGSKGVAGNLNAAGNLSSPSDSNVSFSNPILIALVAINGVFVLGVLTALVFWIKTRTGGGGDKRGKYAAPSDYKPGMIEHQEYHDPHTTEQR